jgi:hypothetical protein
VCFSDDDRQLYLKLLAAASAESGTSCLAWCLKRGNSIQGQFASYPMDDAHLMAAVRYVELNTAAAGMVDEAGDWPWSSACWGQPLNCWQLSGGTLVILKLPPPAVILRARHFSRRDRKLAAGPARVKADRA